MLNNFSSQQGAWKHCLFFLANSANQYVSMYSLTTIEKLITKQWLGLMWEERAQLKATLYQLTLENHHTVPHFIRNKLVKLVVDIARLDWPHFYPDFFTNILQQIGHVKKEKGKARSGGWSSGGRGLLGEQCPQLTVSDQRYAGLLNVEFKGLDLIQSPDNTTLGLVFLLTASEELVYPWEDLSVARKDELKRLLLAYMPQVFNILTVLLETLIQKQRHRVTATPPPSPTHGQPNASSPVHSGSLLSSMLDNTKSSANCGSGRNLDPESETFCCLSLKALTHLFMWVPITNNITPNLMGAIFRLASISSDTSRDESVRTLAMAAINEILYKNCVPASCADFVLNLLQQAMTLLQGWLASPEDIDLQDSYEEKLIEFLRLFVGLHLTRLEDNPCFPMADFADLLLKFTFHGESTEHLVACLEVWDTFLSHLQFKKNVAQWYSDVLISLVKQLLGKCQFRTNQAPLEELDDDTLNDDNQTEWQNFLCDCIDIIDKVITIVPDTTYELLYGNWEQVCKVYVGLQHVICSDTNTQARQLGVKSEHDIGRMHCYMRDLSSLTQIMGRLSAHQIDDFTHGNVIVPLLLNLANFAFEQQLHRLLVSTPVLTTDFVEVHAQVLAALKSWCHWMVPVERHNLIPGLLGSVVPILTTPGEPAKLCHSAAHLLATITAMARPPQIWELEIIRDLYRLVPTLQNLQPETYRLVQRAMCNTLLLVWPGVSDQLWDQRHKLLSALLDSLVSDFRRLGANPPPQIPDSQVGPIITNTLRLLGDLVNITQEEGSASRKLLYSVIQANVHQSLAMFPQYIQCGDVCEAILNFFLTAFSGLTQQLGAPFTEQTVQTFLNMFTREQVQASLGQEGGSGTRVIDKFLQLLQLVMAEPGAAFKGFVSSTIKLCLDHIFPLVCDSPSPDIKMALFTVLHTILLYRWQHFYRASVLESLSSGAGVSDNVNHREHLAGILQAYGQTLLQADINMFAHNLRSLEQVNGKWKLYQKKLFREELLPQFLTVLLHTLLNKSHSLLGDDIAVAIFNMAAVDFPAFHDAFIPHFLRTTSGLDDNQRTILQRNFKRDMDLPSFTQNILRLMNDMRCYRLCNASLPANSVKL
uniref:Importin N-terminal domain-containing protein n=1 Tax=Timema cristinae TaxID=61476 RepID=A0A7R9GQM9_TIMCR|nr:unnamed protein product [Timema cristinae]